MAAALSPQVNVADLIRKQAQVMGSWVLPIHYYYDLVELMVATGTSFAPLDAGRFAIDDAPRAFAFADSPETLGKVSLVWPDRSHGRHRDVATIGPPHPLNLACDSTR